MLVIVFCSRSAS